MCFVITCVKVLKHSLREPFVVTTLYSPENIYKTAL